MLQFIIDFFTASVVPPGTIITPGPLALAGIGMGISALGGWLANRNNERTTVDIPIPAELQDQIGQLSNRNFFMPAIQRAVNDNQGAFNIRSTLASQGINSPAIAAELMEDMRRDQSDQTVGALQQLEGLRLSALNQNLGQLSSLQSQEAMANAQFQQQHTNNKLGIINSAVSGVGSSFIQGMGAKIQQDNFNRFMDVMGPTGQAGGVTGQQGGQGFAILDQFDAGQLTGDIFGGFNTNGFGNIGGVNSDKFT